MTNNKTTQLWMALAVVSTLIIIAPYVTIVDICLAIITAVVVLMLTESQLVI